jgi:hypothetical protein
VVVPESYNGKPVVGIASAAFVYCNTLEKLTLPTSVKFIGRQAFEGCANLESVNLWDVEYIEGFAFNGCKSLKQVELSADMVEDSVFTGCKGLKAVWLLCDTVYGNAFSSCTALEEVTLTSRMTDLDLLTFGGCSALANIYYYGTYEDWNAMDRVEMEDDGFEEDLSWDAGTGEYIVWTVSGSGIQKS